MQTACSNQTALYFLRAFLLEEIIRIHLVSQQMTTLKQNIITYCTVYATSNW